MGHRQRKVVTLDCETPPFRFGRNDLKPFVWGMYSKEDGFRSFTDTEEVVRHLAHQHVLVFAHNGGRFDYQFLIDFMEPYSKIRIIHGRTGAFRIGKALFRDSYLILPTALKNYKKDEIDYRMFESAFRNRPGNMERILDYLEGDCRYLYELVAGFREEYGGSLTLAGSAVRLAKGCGIEFPPTGRSHYNLFAPFFYGGRCECFRGGVYEGVDVRAMDVNSQYPTAMTARHPFGVSCEVSRKLPTDDAVLGRSFIQLSAISTGAFPFRTDTGLSFPADGGRREFKVSGWEYIAARDTGTLVEPVVEAVFVFDDSIDFKSYIGPLYAKKQTLDRKSAQYLYVKLFLNSLYGKTACNPTRYRETVLALPGDMKGPGIPPEGFEGWNFDGYVGTDDKFAFLSRPLPENQHRFYNVATGASITGWGRAMLWKAIRSCAVPYYCDTDGLICEGFRGDVGTALGQWKEEFKAKRVAIAGKKLYALHDGVTRWGEGGRGWKVASKGVRLSGPEIFQLAKGGVLNTQRDAPSMSLKGGVRYIEREVRATYPGVTGEN